MIPLATTTFTVTRTVNDGTRDLYDTPPSPQTLTTTLRGVLSAANIAVRLGGGDRQVADTRLHTDPYPLQPGDLILDNTTGVAYTLLSATSRYELGVTYTVADLRTVEGAAA